MTGYYVLTRLVRPDSAEERDERDHLFAVVARSRDTSPCLLCGRMWINETSILHHETAEAVARIAAKSKGLCAPRNLAAFLVHSS